MIVTTGKSRSLTCKSDFFEDGKYFTRMIKRYYPSLLRFINRKKILIKGNNYSLEEDWSMGFYCDFGNCREIYYLKYKNGVIKFEDEMLSKYFYTEKELRKSKLDEIEGR